MRLSSPACSIICLCTEPIHAYVHVYICIYIYMYVYTRSLCIYIYAFIVCLMTTGGHSSTYPTGAKNPPSDPNEASAADRFGEGARQDPPGGSNAEAGAETCLFL